jgi:hypothetical protein
LGRILIEKLNWIVSDLNLNDKGDICDILEINNLSREKTPFHLKHDETKSKIYSNKLSIEFVFNNINDIERNSRNEDIYKKDYLKINQQYATTPSNLLLLFGRQDDETNKSSDKFKNLINYNDLNKKKSDEVFKMIHTLIPFSTIELCEPIKKKILQIRLTNIELFDYALLNQVLVEVLSSHKIVYSTRKFIQELFIAIDLNSIL